MNFLSKNSGLNILESHKVYKSLLKNLVSFSKGFRKSGLKPTFPTKSKVAFSKTEVLKKPHKNGLKRQIFL